MNVLGEWVGMIVNAPAGATAAQLAGGVSQSNQVQSDIQGTSKTNNLIDNTVNVNAVSGDASISRNTKAGNAASGDADAAVNLLNIASSQMSFADWLGILFINVFGTWNGSFGIDTSAGTPTPAASNRGNSVAAAAQVFRFEPQQNTSTVRSVTKTADVATINGTATSPSDDSNNTVLGITSPETSPPSNTSNDPVLSRWVLPVFGSGLMGLAILGVEQLMNRRRRLATA